MVQTNHLERILSLLIIASCEISNHPRNLFRWHKMWFLVEYSLKYIFLSYYNLAILNPNSMAQSRRPLSDHCYLSLVLQEWHRLINPVGSRAQSLKSFSILLLIICLLFVNHNPGRFLQMLIFTKLCILLELIQPLEACARLESYRMIA